MGHETWIVNASPLIALAKVGQLQLLERTGQQLLIPEAVRGEVAAGGEKDPARAALQAGFGGAAVATIPDPTYSNGASVKAKRQSSRSPALVEQSPFSMTQKPAPPPEPLASG